MKNSALFYTCSLIEYIGRQQKQKRSEVVRILEKESIRRIYNFADVFHCEPIEKTADDFIMMYNIPQGDFDNIARCMYTVPTHWDIGKVYQRLIEDVAKETDEQIIDILMNVYTSWISDTISNYNSDFYYQNRGYIFACYKEGYVLE